MKQSGKIVCVIGVMLFFLGLGVGLYYLENYEGYYYTQIDNTKIEKLNTTDNLKYEYTLKSYSKDGRGRTFKFKTSRELREGAYLKLIVRTAGVYKWEEVTYDSLPDKVKLKYE